MHQSSERDARRAALLTTTLGAFLAPFMGSSVNIALPSIGNELGMNAVLLSWVATSYLLAAAMFLVPFGRMADMYGRKKLFLYGVSLYTLASLLCGLSNSAAALVVFRVLQGIGAAMNIGGVAILTSVFPAEERGRALGINVASAYLGLCLGPSLGGALTQHWGWRSIFLANVPVGLMIIASIIWRLKGEWAEAEGEKLDVGGSLIYGLALIAIVYGFSLLPGMSGASLILMGAGGILTFVVWETRAEEPVLDVGLFKNNTVFAFSNLAALINYSATFAVGFLLSLYLQYIKGLAPQRAGLILVFQPFTMAVLSPFAGRLSDRVEPRIVASVGMALTSAGLFLLGALDDSTPLKLIVSTLTLLGVGFALFSSPNTNAVMGSVERRFYGVASGTLGTMRLIGQMLSMGIAMLMFSIYIGRVRITPEYYPFFLKSAKTAFAIFGALCFGGIFASLARGKVRSGMRDEG